MTTYTVLVQTKGNAFAVHSWNCKDLDKTDRTLHCQNRYNIYGETVQHAISIDLDGYHHDEMGYSTIDYDIKPCCTEKRNK